MNAYASPSDRQTDRPAQQTQSQRYITTLLILILFHISLFFPPISTFQLTVVVRFAVKGLHTSINE